MPSREVRRRKKQVVDAKETQPGQRLKKRPFLYFGSVLILILIVAAFVIGPLLRNAGSQGPIVFGEYDGKNIEFVPGNYLSEQRDRLFDQLRDGATSDNIQWQAYQVWRGAFERTVLHTAILLDAEQAGLYVSDNRIDQALTVSGPYMVNGVFDEKRYRDTPNSERFRYHSLYREDLTHQQYITDVLHYGLNSSKAGEFIKEMGREERKFQFILFTYEDFPVDQVAAYGELNTDLFRKIKLSRITIRSGKSDAENLRNQVVDGVATFEDLAKNYSQDGFADKGGEMGWRTYHELEPDFPSRASLDEVFDLGSEDISGVQESSFGYVFYRVDEEPVDPDFSDDTTIETVREYMTRFERGRIEDYLSIRAEELVSTASDSSLSAAAATEGLTPFETEFFPLNYGGLNFLDRIALAREDDILADDTTLDDAELILSGAAYDEEFFNQLFSLSQGEISNPIVLEDSVAVFALQEKRNTDDEELSFLTDYYPFIRQQYLEQDLMSFILTSDKLEDNFSNIFSEIFVSPSF